MTTLIYPYNPIAGALASLEAVKFLTKFEECNVLEKVIILDLANYEFEKENFVFKGNCEICSKKMIISKKIALNLGLFNAIRMIIGVYSTVYLLNNGISLSDFSLIQSIFF